MDRQDREGWLLVLLALAAMVLLMWLIDVSRVSAAPAAQSGLCPAGEVVSPDYGPLVGADGPGSCSVCCDRSNGTAYWRRLPNWHSFCYPRGRPTRRIYYDTPTPRPTATPTATATPTVTDTVTPLPSATATETPTWTITPTAPAPPDTATPTMTPTATSTRPATPTAINRPPPIETVTARPPGPPSQRPQQGRTYRQPELRCLPKHAGRPVALCDTRSGSGWWLHFVGPGGRIVTGPHVPYPSIELAGRGAVLRHSVTGAPVVLVWSANRLQVRTLYAGKAYIFSVTRDGRVTHEAW